MKNAEAYDLHGALSDANYAFERFFQDLGYPQDLTWYRKLYEQFAGFKWLGLPKNPPVGIAFKLGM